MAYATSIYPLDDADEWRYTACSRLVEHGHTIFKDVFSAQPPLLFLSLAGGMRLHGDDITGARATVTAFGLLALLAAAWLSFEVGGPLAAGTTTVLLAVSPAFLVYARAVEGEGPMMAMATLTLALLAFYARSRRRLLPVLAGLALAAAILMKLFALETVIPALWLLGCVDAPARRRAIDSAQFMFATALPVALDFLLVSPTEQWRQVVQLHEAAARLSLPGVSSTWQTLGTFLAFDPGLSFACAVGLVSLVVLVCRRESILVAGWVGGNVAMLLTFHPLFPHHPAILLTGMACGAGIGVGCVAKEERRSEFRAALVGVGLLLYAVFLPRLLHADRHVLYMPQHRTNGELVRYISTGTTSSQFVAVDDLRLADEAHRLVVPPLCDPSNVRLKTGYLTSSDAISATERYRPQVVLFSFGIFGQLDAYSRWLSRHYASHPLTAHATAYVRRSGGL